jgi:RND family efflux transporter MFP subunit
MDTRLMRGVRPSVWALFLLLLAGACRDPRTSEAGGAAPLRVRVAVVRESRTPRGVPAVGAVEPIRRASPASRLMGTVVAAPFEEGDRVDSGQVLVQIDDRDLAARRTQVESRVGEAEVLLRDAEMNLARMRTLETERAIAGIQLEQAQTGQARAAAGVESARAALRELEANAAYGTITAPFAGEIVRKNLSVGDVATPGAPLFVLEDLSRIRVVASVGEAAAARLRAGARVPVEIEAAGARAVGVVEAVLPSSRPPVTGFRVNVVLGRPSAAVISGMTATVLVPSGEPDAVPGTRLSVPRDALVRRGEMVGVFVVDGTTARLRWVRIGLEEGESVEVLSGLRGGERVVIGASDRLTDGQRIAVEVAAR